MTFFRLKALATAGRLGLSVPDVDRLTSIVISAVGADWLNAAARDIPPSTPIPFPRQPLGHLFHVAGEEQLAEVLELGEYLEALHALPGIDQAIVGLKSSYYQTLLQLAIATRLGDVGAELEQLEPPAASGRVSDIRFRLGAAAARAECYRPTYKPKNEATYELTRLAHAVLQRAGEASGMYAVAIELTVPLTPNLRHEVEEVVRLGIRDLFSGPPRPGMVPLILTRSDNATISICPALPTRPGGLRVLPRHPDFPRTGDDYGIFVRTDIAAIADVAGVLGDPDRGVGTSCVAIWSPELPPSRSRLQTDALLERFGRKLEKKLVQTRSNTSDARLIVADAWEVDRLAAAGETGIARLRGKLIDAHSGVAALVLTHRRWVDELGRFGYPLTVIQSDATPPEVVRLLNALLEAHAA